MANFSSWHGDTNGSIGLLCVRSPRLGFISHGGRARPCGTNGGCGGGKHHSSASVVVVVIDVVVISIVIGSLLSRVLDLSFWDGEAPAVVVPRPLDGGDATDEGCHHGQ